MFNVAKERMCIVCTHVCTAAALLAVCVEALDGRDIMGAFLLPSPAWLLIDAVGVLQVCSVTACAERGGCMCYVGLGSRLLHSYMCVCTGVDDGVDVVIVVVLSGS